MFQSRFFSKKKKKFKNPWILISDPVKALACARQSDSAANKSSSTPSRGPSQGEITHLFVTQLTAFALYCFKERARRVWRAVEKSHCNTDDTGSSDQDKEVDFFHRISLPSFPMVSSKMIMRSHDLKD